MTKKHQDLQPWLDYFQMLHTYEQQGFLQVDAEKHEVYVTQPAFYTLAGCSFTSAKYGLGVDIPHIMTRVSNLVRRLRVYAAWKAHGASDYNSYAFAVNVVRDDGGHAPLYTIVLTTRRRWWKLWLQHDSFEIITY